MKNINNSKLRIIPLGGLEQIGMNITAFEFEDSIVVVDCGLSFPEDDMLGIDLVIPDITYLKNNAHKVKGFVITHGHEDHIGALPYVLKELNVPVYAAENEEISGTGAGLAAGFGLGLYDERVFEDRPYRSYRPRMTEEMRSVKYSGWKDAVKRVLLK